MSKTKKKHTKILFSLDFKATDEGHNIVCNPDVPIGRVVITGKIDGGSWVYEGTIEASEEILNYLKDKEFLLLLHRVTDFKYYTMRLINCKQNLEKASDGKKIDIGRVIFWRPKERDIQEPNWLHKPTIETHI